MLTEIRGREELSASAQIRSVRRTKSGDVLLKLGRNSEGKTALGDSIRTLLGDKASVKMHEPKISYGIRDLDDLATSEEVKP